MLLKYLPSSLLIIFKSTSIRTLVFSLLIIGFIVAFLLDLALGSVSIPIQEVINILLGQEPEKATWANIILKFRLPKAVTATLAGAALGVSGLQMQTLFKNPLAGPFVLGISSGASLGVALVVLTASVTTPTLLSDLGIITDFGLVIAASLGAAAVLSLMLVVARRVQETMTLLILGLLFGYATSAIVSILLQFSSKERIQSYIMWTFGSFAGVTWKQLIVLIPVIVLSLLVAVLQSKSLNALLLGEAYARSLGLTVKKARFSIIGSASILAGGITAFCGPIAFLGVAIPHLCRSLFMSSDHRILIPGVMIMGGILALVADLFSQMAVSQMVLPLNAITALIGTPVVTWVILRRNSRKSFPS
ncbi:iron ABC transporter permease [Fischerella sp. NIES-3754]|uniref:iron ABC transporter permease n=1 Tax=Fischerella sp. NIES-3754 TaxID=1752063 RepID=UPI000722EBDF|nr:iron ABC transporter permease [Fischerella sp. NIES-3754]BAU08796.1 transport system permease protein [Fischerella sp. NIES-3754]BCX06262.1 MAG: iron ABC transporter [Fischerella sp.]